MELGRRSVRGVRTPGDFHAADIFPSVRHEFDIARQGIGHAAQAQHASEHPTIKIRLVQHGVPLRMRGLMLFSLRQYSFVGRQVIGADNPILAHTVLAPA
jgi:hypothetical protein